MFRAFGSVVKALRPSCAFFRDRGGYEKKSHIWTGGHDPDLRKLRNKNPQGALTTNPASVYEFQKEYSTGPSFESEDRQVRERRHHFGAVYGGGRQVPT